eukprot:TRINITY_DN9814_c0_g1_i4.p1 TRINITY_DN9814_c0_g1~~TRINITY_DN9814_c0_g1_i4.p1  ORF type:complete len:108 (-),score=3.77 TRINITY_DN9814_c0_g1_i4:55-378(-)
MQLSSHPGFAVPNAELSTSFNASFETDRLPESHLRRISREKISRVHEFSSVPKVPIYATAQGVAQGVVGCRQGPSRSSQTSTDSKAIIARIPLAGQTFCSLKFHETC